MPPKPLPSLKLLQEYFEISTDSPSGLIWSKRPERSKIKVGDTAGRKHHLGYWQVKIQGKLYLTHRIIYYLKTGINPGNCPVDHPTDRGDNVNTRLASYSQNSCNRPKQKTYKKKETSSKYKGVCFAKKTQKWQASITCNWKVIYLGQFLKEEDAAEVYNKAAIFYFGEFAILNKLGPTL